MCEVLRACRNTCRFLMSNLASKGESCDLRRVSCSVATTITAPGAPMRCLPLPETRNLICCILASGEVWVSRVSSRYVMCCIVTNLPQIAEVIFGRQSELTERPAELERGRTFTAKVRCGRLAGRG